MSSVTSRDGTTIAYTRTGGGPPVILVDGALCYREFGPAKPMAALLASSFTVYTYDRRGRGESGDTGPYSVEREIEDLEALIKEAGGAACVYGTSSGAALALEAANRGVGITKLAVYETPFIVDDSRDPASPDFLPRVQACIDQGRRGDAVKLFMKFVGTPAVFVVLMQLLPVWKKLKAVAHTLPYDLRIVTPRGTGQPLPADAWSSITAPTLVMDGGKSPEWMRNGMRAVAEVVPGAQYRTLEGQTHMLKAQVVAPVLTEFFRS